MGTSIIKHCTSIQYSKLLGNFRIIGVGNISTSNFTFGEGEQEYLLEREAISEFDGGLSRGDACGDTGRHAFLALFRTAWWRSDDLEVKVLYRPDKGND